MRKQKHPQNTKVMVNDTTTETQKQVKQNQRKDPGKTEPKGEGQHTRKARA